MSILAALVLVLAGCSATAEPEPDRSRIPRRPYCDPVRDWPRAWADAERALLDRIANVRESGIDCASAGKHGIAPPLVLHGALTCAARVHARDMATRSFLGHVDPEGVDPKGRAEQAGYADHVIEHWAAGPDDVHVLVDELWLRTDSICADLAARDRVHIGVGHVADVEDDHGTYWVMLLGGDEPPAPETTTTE